jgi:bifunctional NMN adenylyltransferase/nudix hydrolase
MPKRKYDVLVFIGRFQPFHNGHKAVIDRALELADNVLVLVGSANRSRNMRNPFTAQERKLMIRYSYTPEYENDSVLNERMNRLHLVSLNDVMYNDERWIEQVQRVTQKKILDIINSESPNVHLHGLNDARIGLIGCQKDGTSYYLKLFPTWESEGIPHIDNINSTDIRKLYFEGNDEYKDNVPDGTVEFLEKFRESEVVYNGLVESKKYLEEYREIVHKYPRIEHTVDAVVVQSGHVLLVRRRAEPGRGQWAIPGGFIRPDERLRDAMLRELREETKIKVPEPVLRGNIVKSDTYDDPNRSSRGRIITQAYLIKLPYQTELPKVKGSDDADKAKWVPLASLRGEDLFEDHYFIIQDLLGEL